MKTKSAPYRWHLNKPWKEEFSHKQWWIMHPDERTELAALWEVLRRHPKAGELRQPDAMPSSLFDWFILTHGLTSWQQFNAMERREWSSALGSLPPQRGIDPRPLYCITAQSWDVRHGAHPQTALLNDKRLAKASDAESRRCLDEAKRIQEDEIVRLALEHHRAGRVLVAFDPDVANVEELAGAFKRCVETQRVPSDQGRCRHQDWLDVIASYETTANPDAQLSARFRRIIASLRWP